ncbi:MAG TPA: HNH endonuclease [Candidatus Accumulibacter phosphatis]|nr:MAG: hypothetical protein AW07_00380 [Candidatus Accumulibacter sp. SK-11]HRL74146.1 HNH endonuclease [Candidatus Accumulibacter phosphatis]HRQ95662.1 HNH endonuclease [Candidatus Accumulibacter phosphatis]
MSRDRAGAGGVLDQTRVEKAAQDAGFDLTPSREGPWMSFRSSVCPQALGVLAGAGERYRVGFAVAVWGHKVAHDCATVARFDTGPWPAVVDQVRGYEALHAMIQRAGRVACLLSGEGERQFAGEAQRLPATTEAERLVIQRVGQAMFRESLIDYWHGRCAVTGLDVLPLPRASHIKPWAECESDAERLDVFNGLLLAPHLDALFDGGWISFDEDGGALVSPELSGDQQARLGVQPGWWLAELAALHIGYLVWHRRQLFRR